MISALTQADVEERVKRTAPRSVLLIFSAYNREMSGPNAEFLSRILDYHYQSGQTTDCHCVGYSAYEPDPNIEFGRAVKLPPDTHPFTFFYPKLFHDIRTSVQRGLSGKWEYTGGVDMLLFPTADRGTSVIWDTAAVLRSHQLVGQGFRDVDEMIRTVLNLNERLGGQMDATQLEPEVNRRRFVSTLSDTVGQIGAALISGGLAIVG